MNDLEIVNESKINEYIKAFGLTTSLTDQEKNQFVNIAKEFQLNPFKREIYCIPYGTGKYRKLSIITGYEVYLKRADRTGKLAGWGVSFEGSVKVETKKVTKRGENGDYQKEIKVPVGDLRAVITIYRKDWDKPFTHTAYLEEYAQENEMWEAKPRTMLQKVVTGQGFRLAFPDEMAGMPYLEEELDNEMRDITPSESKKKPELEQPSMIESPPETWSQEWNRRVADISGIAAKWTAEERDAMEIKSLILEGKKEPSRLELAEARVQVYEKFRNTTLAGTAVQMILEAGPDIGKITAIEIIETVEPPKEKETKSVAKELDIF